MKRNAKKSYYSITEAAKTLGVSRAAIHEAIRKGKLEASWGKVIQVVRTEVKALRIPAKSLGAYKVSLSHQARGKKRSR